MLHCVPKFEPDTEIGQKRAFFKGLNTSEYDLVDQGCPLKCLCGSQNCIGDVKGFKYLPVGHKKKIEAFLSPFLKREVKK